MSEIALRSAFVFSMKNRISYLYVVETTDRKHQKTPIGYMGVQGEIIYRIQLECIEKAGN